MELKFIWINKHTVFQKFGVNFNHSQANEFSFDEKGLHIHAREKPVIHFGNNVSSVTVIAGENGSGKTTFCNEIISSLATADESSYGFNEIFIGIIILGKEIFAHQSLNLGNTDELEGLDYEIKYFRETPYDSVFTKEVKEFLKHYFIYYSNQFDARNPEGLSLQNLSSINIWAYDREISPSYAQSNETPQNVLTRSDYSIYLKEESYRFVRFMSKAPDFIPFRRPKKFVLYNTFSGNNKFLRERNDDNYKVRIFLDNIERQLLRGVFDDNASGNTNYILEISEEKHKRLFKFLYGLNVIRRLAFKKDQNMSYVISDLIPNDLLFERFISTFLIYFINNDPQSTSLYRMLDVHGELVDKSVIPVKNMMLYTYRAQHHRLTVDQVRFSLIEKMQIELNDSTLGLLRELIRLEEEVLNFNYSENARISNYELGGHFSAGENSFLSFFSRLDLALDRLRRHDTGKIRENIILFIDEGEIGFHPNWQRKFFSWVRKYLKEYASDYTFQLFFTTHSPFLLSDFPRENVILLQKGQDGFSELVDKNLALTFGGNIHELLYDAFFLREGAVGEFATEKIQEVIDDLNRWRRLKATSPKDHYIDQNEVEKVRSVIRIVADPVVKYKLEQMYQEVFGKSQQEIDREIQLLQERINQLRNQ